MRPDRSNRPSMVPSTVRVAAIAALALLVATAPAQAGITSPYVRKAIKTLAPGITWERGVARTSNGIQAIQVGRIDMHHPQVSLQSLLSNDRVIKLERPSIIAQRNSKPGSQAIVATNGDVSTAGDWGAGAHPPSMHVHQGEVMVGSSCGRPSLGVDADGTARMGAVKLKTTLDITSVVRGWQGIISVRGVNRQRSSGQLIVYTNRWGPTTLTTASGTEVVVDMEGRIEPNGRITGIVETVRQGTQNSQIPTGRMVLSGQGDMARILNQLSDGDEIAIETSIYLAEDMSCARSEIAEGWQDVVEVMGGNYFTARNGRNVAPSYSAYAKGGYAAPRTNVGITADGDVLMVVVDGRQSGYSIGMTLIEMGDLMLQLGAVTAFNLDGGGSTIMATRAPGADRIAISNRPSDGRERPLTQALAAFSIPEP